MGDSTDLDEWIDRAPNFIDIKKLEKMNSARSASASVYYADGMHCVNEIANACNEKCHF